MVGLCQASWHSQVKAPCKSAKRFDDVAKEAALRPPSVPPHQRPWASSSFASLGAPWSGELVVDEPPGRLLQSRHAGARVDVDRVLLLHRLVLAGLAELGRVVEEARGNRLADVLDVVGVARHLDLDPLAQTLQLLVHVASAVHATVLHKVLVAPLRGEVRVRPLGIAPEQQHVVATAAPGEVVLGVVGMHGAVLRPVEDGVVDAEHGHDGHHLLHAGVILRGNDSLALLRLERKLGHLPPELGELSSVIQRAQRVQLLESADQRLGGRRVHEVEVEQIVDAQALQQQHDVAHVRSLNLRHGLRLQLVLVRPRGVQAEARSRLRAARPA
eukprot:scaffold2448_cov250-Pinguiococcus_pyrenoidosus.AAC.17